MRLIQMRLFFWSVLIGIYLFAWGIEAHLFLNGDVSILMHEAQSLFSGGVYGKDFYEINPPLILYLSVPPVLLMKFLHWNIFIAWRAYSFLLASLSLFICYKILGKIFSNKEDAPIISFLLLSLAAIFLVLPVGDFGQRDHLLVIFTLPYLLLLTCRLEEKTISKLFALFIGFFAVLGFAIKPQFMLPLVLLEGYGIVRQRSFFSVIRIETMAMIGLMVVYLLSVFLFQPTYFSVIVPLASRIYYAGVGAPWREVLAFPVAIYCLFPLLFLAIQYPYNPKKILSSVLSVALIGYLMVYVLQETAWYYHVLPALSMALFLFVLVFAFFVLQTSVPRREAMQLFAFCLLLFGFVVFFRRSIWVSIIFFPNIFYGLFAVLFSGLFFLADIQIKIIRIVASTSLIIGAGYLFSYFAQHTDWYAHRFFFTIVLLILLFCLLASKARVSRFHLAMAACLGMCIFAYPVFQYSMRYYADLSNTEKSQSLINFLREHAANKNVYFLSSQFAAYPLIDYAGVNYASRYSMLIWVQSLVKQAMRPLSLSARKQFIQDKNDLIGSVGDELSEHKPILVFVDVQKFTFNHIHYDYIKQFSENSRFKNAWKAYHYLTTLEVVPAYRLAVYQRIDS